MIPVGGASILKAGRLFRRVAVCLIHDSLQNFHLAILSKTLVFTYQQVYFDYWLKIS